MDDIEILKDSLNILRNITSKSNPYSSIEVVDLMIYQENLNKKAGFSERLKSLDEIKNYYIISSK